MTAGIQSFARGVGATIGSLYSGESPASKKASSVISVYSKMLNVVRNSMSFLNNVAFEAPPSLMDGLKVAKAPLLLTVPCTVRNLAKNVTKIFAEESSLKKRVMNGLKALPNIQILGGAAATVCEIAKVTKLVGPHITSWIPVLGYLALVTNTIGLGLSIRSTVQTSLILKTICSGLKVTSANLTEKEKCEALVQALTQLEEKGIDKVAKKLSIGKEAKLAERIKKLKEKLQTGDVGAVQETQDALAILKKRSIRMIVHTSVQSVTNIISIAGGIFSSFTPFPPVGYGLAAVGAGLAFLTWGTDYFLVNSNPFDPESKCRAVQMIDTVRSHVETVKNAVQSYVAQRVIRAVVI